MTPKTPQVSKVYEKMVAMLADQFYHQPGANITINRAALADMLTKQTMHGFELGAAAERERIGRFINSTANDMRKLELVVQYLNTPTNTV